MGLQINTNISALNSLRNLQNVNNSVSSSIEKLSSGLRINQASDDPSGLIISEGLRAQVDGLNQAIANSQEAGNVIKTAEGALSSVSDLLRNVRTLAVHAANVAMQVHGGYGYMEESAIPRFYRDAKILTIGEGTSEILKLVIARQMGLSV